MPGQPTPQPSGRTLAQMLVLFGLACADDNAVTKENFEQVSRQLFDAMLEIVGPNIPNLNGAPHIVTWNRRLAEQRERLRVFFNQPEANGKDGGK